MKQGNKTITITKVREILGDSVNQLNDNQILEIITNMNNLVNIFLDLYERKVFDGKTLREMKTGNQFIDF